MLLALATGNRSVLGVALAPAALVGPAVVRSLGGRSDLAGALAIGSVVLSFALVLAFGGEAATRLAVVGIQVFGLSAAVGNSLPTLRDRALGAIRVAGDLALFAALGLAIASGPRIDLVAAALAAAALLLGIAVALAAALVARKDALASATTGMRDPVVAIAIASTIGEAALGVAVAYAVLTFLVSAALLAAGRSRPRGAAL